MENFDMNQSKPDKFIFKKEREFGDIISDTFSFFSKNHKVLSKLFLKFIGPFVLLTIFATTLYQYKTGDLFTDITVISTNPDSVVRALSENLLLLLFYLLISLVTTIITYGTVIHAVKSYINNNGEILDADISEGLKKDFFKMLVYLVISFIVVFVGLFLCILPGIYLGVILTPGIVMLVMEEVSATDAFSKSFQLIKDNWWITFATFLVFNILIGILGFVFQIPTFIYSFIEGFTAIESAQNGSLEVTEMYQDWLFLLFTAIGVLGQYFLNIFSVIMVTLVYFNLSEKQNFSGTYEQIDQIGN
jgi:hypothetical protein